MKRPTIYTLIRSEHSKEMWERVARIALKDSTKFDELLEIFFSDDYRMVQRSSQCLGKLHDLDSQRLQPYTSVLISGLHRPHIVAYRRNVLRILQDVDMTEDDMGTMYELALQYLLSKEEPIAIKAFSMTVLRRICEQYPELSESVTDAITLLVEHQPSPGILSRSKKELKILKKLTS